MKMKFRYFLGNILGFLLYYISFKKKLKEKNQIIALYFHNISPYLFEKCIKCLIKKSFTFIDPERLEQILIHKNRQIDNRYVLVTFDDGWKSNLELLPIINKYQVYTILFVATDPILTGNFWWEYNKYTEETGKKRTINVEKLKKISNQERLKTILELKNKTKLLRSAMNLEELTQFSQNKFTTIGSHTVNHPITVRCSNLELEFEYKNSKKTLEDWLGKEIRYFSYPNGDYDLRDIEYLRQANYIMAFSTKSNRIDQNTNIYQIPRFPINDDGGFYENRAKMFGLWKKVFK